MGGLYCSVEVPSTRLNGQAAIASWIFDGCSRSGRTAHLVNRLPPRPQFQAHLARSDDDTGLCLHAYPVLQHIKHLADSKMLWAPDIDGGFVLTTRGGGFEVTIGQDLSIGYLSHSATAVSLYLQEAFTFQMLTSGASVVLAPEAKSA